MTEGEIRQDDLEEEKGLNINISSLYQEILLLFTICSSQGLVQACLAQSFVPMQNVGKFFGSSQENIAWFPAGYALTCGTFMLAFGSIGDKIGHKHIFITAWIWLAGWSLIAGISNYTKSEVFFDICRAFQGIAAAALVPSALAMLGIIYKPGKRKTLAFSLFAAGAPIGFTLGAVFSAVFSQLTSWPYTYYTTTIATTFFAVLSFIVIPSLPQNALKREKKIDYIGAFLGCSGLILFNFAWNRAPAARWSSTECIVTLIISIVLLILFFLYERSEKQPLLPVEKMSSKVLWTIVVEALGWSSFGILVFYSVNFELILRQKTQLTVASEFSPVPIAGLSASLLTSFLLSKAGWTPSMLLSFSQIWFCVGNIFLATMPVQRSYWLSTFWAYTLSPFGMDMSFPAGAIMLSDLLPVESQGLAASLIATTVFYSQSVGLGIAGTVEAYVAHGNILLGYRSAFYVGVGLSGLGCITGLVMVFFEQRNKHQAA